LKFIIDNENDEIQRHWVNNVFYEERELREMSRYIKPKSAILDIGANVGNHAMWFDKNTDPRIVYVIEPHPRAISIMLQNAAINYCHRICFDYLGVAFGEFNSKCTVMEENNNLGATKLKVSDKGFVNTIPGDDLMLLPDFIKIDVEGMEIETIRGIDKTIRKCRPNMFVEVETSNDETFRDVMKEYNYVIVFESQNYMTCKNYIVCPK
jgi:FkbM family methyltransferase